MHEDGILWETGIFKAIEGVMSGKGMYIDAVPGCENPFEESAHSRNSYGPYTKVPC